MSDNEFLIIRMQFFANRNIKKMKSNELKKSIETWKQRISEHEVYIQNPKEHCPEWDSYDSRRQAGLLKHWNKEIQTFSNDIKDALEELKERGES